jgi:histidine triad (HIT) family protein
MLNDEQTQNIKLQLLKQLENFPEDQRKMMKHKIISMGNEEMEQFVQENKLDHLEENDDKEEEKPSCIFCAIAENKLKSYKISENEHYVAILELNPLSKGDVLIIPKKHTTLAEIKEDSLDFAKKVSEILMKKLNPKEIKLSKNEIMTHAIIEIIPIYGNETERKKVTEEELAKLQQELSGEKKEKEEAPVGVSTEEQKKIPEIPLPPKEPEKKQELPKIPLRLKWI